MLKPRSGRASAPSKLGSPSTLGGARRSRGETGAAQARLHALRARGRPHATESNGSRPSESLAKKSPCSREARRPGPARAGSCVRDRPDRAGPAPGVAGRRCPAPARPDEPVFSIYKKLNSRNMLGHGSKTQGRARRAKAALFPAIPGFAPAASVSPRCRRYGAKNRRWSDLVLGVTPQARKKRKPRTHKVH